LFQIVKLHWYLLPELTSAFWLPGEKLSNLMPRNATIRRLPGQLLSFGTDERPLVM
jgi:hypothetical protein